MVSNSTPICKSSLRNISLSHKSRAATGRLMLSVIGVVGQPSARGSPEPSARAAIRPCADRPSADC